jgi:hypothetical protein
MAAASKADSDQLPQAVLEAYAGNRALESLQQLSNGNVSLLKLDDAFTQLIASKIRAVAAEK